VFASTVTWIDIGTRETLTVLHSEEGTTTTLPALRVLSNATVTTFHEAEITSHETELASSATYPDLDDTWIITGEDEGGNRTQVYVPSPLLATALDDLVNYAAATDEWIALEAALPALAVPYTGASINELIAATVARDSGQVFQTWRNFTDTVDWARRTLKWWDIHGNSRLTHLVGITDSLGTDFDAIMDAMLGVSAAVITHYWEAAMQVFADEPTTDDYNSVNDMARFTFVDGTGCETVVVLPAPNRAIFLADGKTVNLDQANVITFVDAALTELVSPISGELVTRCVGGVLSKRTVY